MPTLLNTLFTIPLQSESGQLVRASSVKDWRTSNSSLHDWQRYW
jgi:hypothetical protein